MNVRNKIIKDGETEICYALVALLPNLVFNVNSCILKLRITSSCAGWLYHKIILHRLLAG